MVLPIYTLGQPVLRKVAEDIDPEDPEIQQFVQNMFDTLDHSSGIGLAAPQVGRSQRIVVIDEAFEKFFEAYRTNVGNDAVQKIITEVKEGQNYLNKFSQINMTIDEINKKGNEVIKKLITDEINYVKKEL